MSEYDDVVESTLLEEEQVLEQNEHGGPPSGLLKFASLYITGISLLVAVTALATALAADAWMEDALESVADRVDLYTLRVESRCHEIQQGLADLRGNPLDSALLAEMARTKSDLQAVKRSHQRASHEAETSDRAHYTLAVAITFFQMATALAAIMSTTRRVQLIYASAAFAVGGAVLTVVGVSTFFA